MRRRLDIVVPILIIVKWRHIFWNDNTNKPLKAQSRSAAIVASLNNFIYGLDTYTYKISCRHYDCYSGKNLGNLKYLNGRCGWAVRTGAGILLNRQLSSSGFIDAISPRNHSSSVIKIVITPVLSRQYWSKI